MSKCIGYDLGDGDTCISIYKNENGTWVVRQIDMPDTNPGEPMPTIVCIRPNDEVVIGYDVVYEDCDMEDAELCVNFKRRPTELSADELEKFKVNVVAFTEQLFRSARAIQDCFSDSSEKDFKVAIGYPTTWSDEDELLYRSILESAACFSTPGEFFGREDGISVMIYLHKESDAAFMNLLNSQSGAGEYAITVDDIPSGNYAVVFDFGSSTADVTILRNTNGHIDTDDCVSGDCHLGARYIDRGIYEEVLSRMPTEDREALLRRYREKGNKALESQNVFFCRLAKQAYFNALPSKRNAGRFSVQNPENSESFNLRGIFPKNAVEIMCKVLDRPIPELDGKSWKEACDELFNNVRNALAEQGQDPILVFLTGGASRMDFVRENAAKYFSDVKIIYDEEPAHCISHGLAYLPRKLEKAKAFLDEVDDFVGNKIPKTINDESDELAKSIATTLRDNILSTARKEAEKWRSGGYQTLNGMENGMRNAINGLMTEQEVERILGDPIKNFISEKIQPTVVLGMERICKKYNIEFGSYKAGKVGGGIDKAGIGFDDISELIAAEFARTCSVSCILAVVKTVTGVVLAAVGVVVLALVTGIVIPVVTSLSVSILLALGAIPVAGWAAIVAILGISLWALKKRGIEGVKSDFIQNVKGWDLYQWIRDLISDNKLDSIFGEVRYSTYEKIYNALKQSEDFKNGLREGIGGPIATRFRGLAKDWALRLRN